MSITQRCPECSCVANLFSSEELNVGYYGSKKYITVFTCSNFHAWKVVTNEPLVKEIGAFDLAGNSVTYSIPPLNQKV